MKRMISTSAALVIVCLTTSAAQAHELWFQPSGETAATVRLTFGDSPAPGEAERVAEIAHAKVWGDGMPLEVKRLSDGLEAWLPKNRPAVLSAYADRGVVDYQGDSFVIYLAAYAQSKPVKSTEISSSGSPTISFGCSWSRAMGGLPWCAPLGEENRPPMWSSRFSVALIRLKFARINGAKSLAQTCQMAPYRCWLS